MNCFSQNINGVDGQQLREAHISSAYSYLQLGLPVGKFQEKSPGSFFGAGLFATFFNSKYEFLELGADINFLILNGKTTAVPLYLNNVYVDDVKYSISNLITPFSFKIRFTKVAEYWFQNLPFLDIYLGGNYLQATTSETLEKLDINRSEMLFNKVNFGYGIGFGYIIFDFFELGVKYYGTPSVKIIDNESITFNGSDYSYKTINTPLNLILFHLSIGLHTHDKSVSYKKH